MNYQPSDLGVILQLCLFNGWRTCHLVLQNLADLATWDHFKWIPTAELLVMLVLGRRAEQGSFRTAGAAWGPALWSQISAPKGQGTFLERENPIYSWFLLLSYDQYRSLSHLKKTKVPSLCWGKHVIVYHLCSPLHGNKLVMPAAIQWDGGFSDTWISEVFELLLQSPLFRRWCKKDSIPLDHIPLRTRAWVWIRLCVDVCI